MIDICNLLRYSLIVAPQKPIMKTTKQAQAIAPLAPLHSYDFEGEPPALMSVTLGRDFDQDECPDSMAEVFVSFPAVYAAFGLGGPMLREWVKLNLPGWTYLESYDATGTCCPVEGWPESDTPF